MQLGKRSCVALAAVALRTSGFPVVVEVRRPQPPGNSTLLTVTLCLHFTLTDNLWFTTVVKGGEAAVVSTGVRGERCHLMLQNAATICVKSQVCSWGGRLHIDRHVRDDVVCARTRRRRDAPLSRCPVHAAASRSPSRPAEQRHRWRWLRGGCRSSSARAPDRCRAGSESPPRSDSAPGPGRR